MSINNILQRTNLIWDFCCILNWENKQESNFLVATRKAYMAVTFSEDSKDPVSGVTTRWF